MAAILGMPVEDICNLISPHKNAHLFLHMADIHTVKLLFLEHWCITDLGNRIEERNDYSAMLSGNSKDQRLHLEAKLENKLHLAHPKSGVNSELPGE